MTLPNRGGEAGISVQGVPRFVDRKRHDIELNVRRPGRRVFGARAATNLAGADGQRPAPPDGPVQPHPSQRERIANLIVE